MEAQTLDPTSTLNLYRAALALRQYLRTADESIEWIDTGLDGVLRIRRPGGWQAVLNTGPVPYPMPEGTVLLASRTLSDPARIPADTAVWIQE